MKQPQLKTNRKTGGKSLVCYYDPEKNDYDEQIDAALEYFRLKNTRIPIIALPDNSQVDDRSLTVGRERKGFDFIK